MPLSKTFSICKIIITIIARDVTLETSMLEGFLDNSGFENANKLFKEMSKRYYSLECDDSQV